MGKITFGIWPIAIGRVKYSKLAYVAKWHSVHSKKGNTGECMAKPTREVIRGSDKKSVCCIGTLAHWHIGTANSDEKLAQPTVTKSLYILKSFQAQFFFQV